MQRAEDRGRLAGDGLNNQAWDLPVTSDLASTGSEADRILAEVANGLQRGQTVLELRARR